ncbi:MAG: hypothetical protein FGM57_01195 [Candidatus Taylorbacteria bacterium]|nr:hypothetical protein [Candidatus Taylorbacteria bacterium]
MKTLRYTICILLLTVLSIGTFFENTLTVEANAEAEALQKLIEEKSKNLEQLNKEIKLYEELTDKTSQEAKTLQGLIRQLEQNAKAIDLDIRKTNGKIDLTNLDIRKIDGNISDTESRIQKLQDGISASIREIQMAEDRGMIEHLLSQKTLTGFLSEVEYQLGFNEALQAQIGTMRKQKDILESNKHDKEEKKDELVKLQNELSGKKKAVLYTKSERDRALKDTKNQEKNYQKILKDKLALKAATEKEVFEYESKLKYTLDPSSIPQAGSSALQWPLDKVRITQRFGKTVAARRLYVSGSHNGVDFGAPIGTPVKSAASGTVIGAGDTDLTCRGASFGRWILVRHNNGLSSIYAHLSVISVQEGQTVAAGDVIGYSGNTGYSTGPHLHLGVYAADAVKVENRPSASCGGRVYRMPIAPIDAYLDPMLYLPATN